MNYLPAQLKELQIEKQDLLYRWFESEHDSETENLIKVAIVGVDKKIQELKEKIKRTKQCIQ